MTKWGLDSYIDDKAPPMNKRDKFHYFGKITSTKWPFLCSAQDKPVMYGAKGPTEINGSISVHKWMMW